VLTKVRAYSSWQSAQTLLLDAAGRPETDLLQVRDITGLGPVEASINSVPSGSIDGESYSGSNVGRRNIVLTVKPNPDWATWTFESLRKLVYSYFMPRLRVRLVFETDELDPVEIYGYVESVEPVIFSKDGEISISVICPSPHFTAVTPTEVIGTNDTPVTITYDGNIETPFNLKVVRTSGATPIYVQAVFLGSPPRYQQVAAPVSATEYFVSNSAPGNKYVRMVNSSTGVFSNLLSKIWSGSAWLTLQPGDNEFILVTDQGAQDWTLTYYRKYGGL
jgi:Phage tail protein